MRLCRRQPVARLARSALGALQGFFAIDCPATTNEAARGFYCPGMHRRASGKSSLIERVTCTGPLVRAGPCVAGEIPGVLSSASAWPSSTLESLFLSRRSLLACCAALPSLQGFEQEGPAVYAARRRRLAEAVGRGAIALLGYGEDEGRSGFTGFRQESNFYYLTGHDEPGAALLIAARHRRDPYREVLFLSKRSRRAKTWSGPLLGPMDAGRLGFQEVLGFTAWKRELRALARDRGRLFGLGPPAVPGWSATRDARLLDRLREAAGGAEIRDVRGPIATQRSIKSEGEIALLQRAVDATATAYRAAWTRVQAGATEREVVAEFVAVAFRSGCERLAFPPMVGAGPRSTILHYQRNDGMLEQGQLLLMDAGGEFSRYAADIARTIPVGGRFNTRQRRLYELVLGAQQAAVAAVRPGTRLHGPGADSLASIAQRFLRKHAPRGVETHLPHALGHHVGLDVHDPNPARDVLRKGMVLAIEPGLYLPDEGLGIRIEDMVEVTSDGCRVMSRGLASDSGAIEVALGTSVDT